MGHSHVKLGPNGPTSFVGPDAVDLFALVALRAGLKMYAASGMVPNRSWTLTRMLNKETASTGRKYPRTRKGAQQAFIDLDAVMLAAKEKSGDHRMTPIQRESYKLRYRGFAEHMTAEEREECCLFTDEWDDTRNVHLLNIENKVGLRLHIGNPSPMIQNFGYCPPEKWWVESSKFCIDPNVGVTERMKLITRLFSRVLQYTSGKPLYTTGTGELGRVYQKVMGFEKVPGVEPVVIFPIKEPTHLLRMDPSRWEAAAKRVGLFT